MPKTATPRKPETVSRKLAETRNTSKNRSLSSLLGIGDNEKRLATDIGSGLNDVIGRGTIAGLLGLPGDLGGAAENGLRSLLGLPQVVPYGGSEHIGQKMEQAGLVSDVRRPKTELLASLISPAQAATAGYKAPQMARAGVKALDNLSAPSTLAMANKPASQRGIFAGINARNAPKDALEQGAKLLDEGADPRQVWKDLGVFRGADGKMRWEIDDSKASYVAPSLADIEDRVRVGDRLNHPELYDAYPRQMSTRFTTAIPDAGGHWDEPSNLLGIKPGLSAGDSKSIAVHELQHGVQSNEGFALGGSPRDHAGANNWESLHERVKGYQPEYRRAFEAAQGKSIDSPEMAELERVVELYGIRDYIQKRLKPVDPVQHYMRLGGEAEARATQARLGMNAEQRRAVYPFDSYDVPVDELIHRNGVLPQGILGK